ncbi:MAG: mechanosensitive ion channel family protein [Actinomycetota bacterium]|nr:mechanosensitive ion channel family protein [Actinomycetota bacterium]
MPTALTPDCAADLGSWCQRIWSRTGIGWLAENIDGIVRHGLRVLLILAIALVVRFLAHRAINRLTRISADGRVPGVLRPLKERADAIILGSQGVARRSQRAQSIGSLLKSVTSFVIVTVSLILILAEVGINVAPLLASAGIAGVAIGFGAQNMVKDFLSGIFMLLEDQYGVGDVVDLGSATGTVIGVGLRTTTLRGADGIVWYVRNGEVLRVGNSSQGESVLTIDLPLGYRADAAKAGEVALAKASEVATSEEFAEVVTQQPQMQGVVSMTTEAVTIRLVATVRAGEQWAFGRAVRGAIKEAFDAEGIAAPAADLGRWGANDRTGEAT